MLISLHHSKLQRWPGQMRQRYDKQALDSLAKSQARRAKEGLDPLIQPIIVTPGPGKKYSATQPDLQLYVLAGSRRWESNKLLGPTAPALNAIVREYKTEAEMLADMRTENGQRVDPSPLEWARHFKASLAADPKLSARELAEEAGKTVNEVNTLLQLLELPEVVQAIYDAGELPISSVKDARRLSNDPNTLIRAAKTWAIKGASGKTIEHSVRLLLVRKRKPKLQRKKAPATNGPNLTGPIIPADLPTLRGQALTAEDLRLAAAVQCGGCSVNRLKLKEPAWHIALHAAGKTCEGCDLKLTQQGCSGCPLPEMLQRLYNYGES